MTLTSDSSSQEESPSGSPWAERQSRFEAQQEAYLQEIAASRSHRLALRQQSASFEEERVLLQQERAGIWNNLQAEWQQRGRDEQVWSQLRWRRQMWQEFADNLAYHRQHFSARVHAFQERIAALRDQRRLLRELADRSQQQEAYNQLQASYLELQQELQDERRFLRELQDSYSELRLDYQAQQQHIHSLKPFAGHHREA